jgi:hypothetical protein
MFSVDQRERVRDRLLERARSDSRIVAGAKLGSETAGGADRWSDIDLAFGLVNGLESKEVLDAWTGDLARDFGAAPLFDLPFRMTLYRVSRLPGKPSGRPVVHFRLRREV